MKKYSLILIVIILTGCQEDLTGHWHTQPIDGKKIMSFEILENNSAYIFYYLNDDPIKGELFSKENHLFFPGDCGSLSFDYIFKNKKLYMTNALGTEVVAERIKDPCDRFQDFHTLLNIDYLIIKNKRENLQPLDSIPKAHIKEYINIDYSKKGDSIQLEYSDRISNIQNLGSIQAYIENNYSEGEIPFIHYILTPDKHIKAKDLKLVIDNMKIKNKFHIRTLKPKIENWKAFEYIPIDAIDLNSTQQLQQIIN